jgi:hypothetical protein
MEANITRTPLKAFGRCASLLVLLLCIAVFAGCNRGPAMYEVSGKVLFTDGTAPAGGVAVVRLQPVEGSTAELRKGASSAIGPDGSFEMYTRTPGDGVYEGDYAVTFAVQKGVMDATPLIPAKYMNPQTSGFTVKVDGDKTELKFELEPLPGVRGAKAARAGGAPPTRG